MDSPHDAQVKKKMRILSSAEDECNLRKGSLIPRSTVALRRVAAKQVTSSPRLAMLPAALPAVLVFFVAVAIGAGLFSFTPQVASVFTSTDTQVSALHVPIPAGSPAQLVYGDRVSLSESSVFERTRNAYIDAGRSFVEIDQVDMKVRLFENGVLSYQTKIIEKAAAGSVCETPAGIYEIDAKQSSHRSKLTDLVYPYRVTFAGNYALHGEPMDASGAVAAPDGAYDCFRLADTEMASLYKELVVGMPVLVYTSIKPTDQFTYTPKAPIITAPQYLVADLNTNSLIAGEGLDEVSSIASLTKLMAALVAMEELDLTHDIAVSESSLIASVIPRLKQNQYVSVQELLSLLLVESSNEAAELLAGEVGRDRFVALMNQKATLLGLTDTVFVDPSGLGVGNQSSVRDLFTLAKHINDNRSFIWRISAEQRGTAYTEGAVGEYVNFNTIKGLEHFVGGKVGETRAAGQTSITVHALEIDGSTRPIVVILLNSTERTNDVLRLIEYTKEQFAPSTSEVSTATYN